MHSRALRTRVNGVRREANSDRLAARGRADKTAHLTARRNPKDIRAAAVAMLARRDYLAADLCQRLQSRGFDPAATATVTAELAAERLLDDARFVERFVASRAERGQGPLRIAADLRSRGASEASVEAAIRAGPDWLAVVREVRRRKFGPEPPRSWPEKARQARFLQSRGFSSDHIRAATGADFED